ncbi:MAG TPA: glycosyltransferase family 39 protein [Opitutales bacterium]|jgi:4-amino-4-deoxy-L-arabinose transferase-like glycosyltransferase|nr:glycosyltransferase family 39 protein [Opitutales bacterium]
MPSAVSAPAPLPLKRGVALVTAGYFLSRSLFCLIGIRFDGMDNLNSFLQFIDPPLLQHDLLASLYYSSFPPLYNLIVGVMLKLFGESAAAFSILHLFLGWMLGLVLFVLFSDLGIGRRVAAAAALLFLILPPAILYENWLLYTYLETLLFTLTVWCFLRFIQTRRFSWSLALFACAAALALLNARMMFFVFIIAFFLWLAWRQGGRPPKFARTAALSATPLLLVVLVMAKNAWLFGTFTVDPHFGFHMGNGFIFEAWRDDETHAVCESDYPLLLIPPTLFPSAEKAGLEPPAKTGIPILDSPTRSTGYANYNSKLYLMLSPMYTDELVDFIQHHPLLYARFVKNALLNYWQPSNEYSFWQTDNPYGFSRLKNRQALGLYDSIYSKVYPLFLLAYLAGMIGVLCVGWSRRWADAYSVTLTFALATVAYNMLAVFVTLGENDRYKFTVEPLLWVIAVCFLAQLFRGRKSKI